MKKAFLALAAVATLFATSCNKETNAPENITAGEGEFLATIDNGANPQNAPVVKDGMSTMTTIDGNRFVIWEAGDTISVNNSKFVTDMTGSSVKFTPAPTNPSDPEPASVSEPGYFAFYPSTITKASMVLPDNQIYETGKVKNLPMYAFSQNNQLTFHNICAVLKIVIPSFLNGATRIEVSSDKALHGTFTIGDNFAANLTPASTDADKKLTVKKQNDVAFYGNDTVYIAVPAMSYESLKVEFFNGAASIWTKTVGTQNLAVNKIYTINISTVAHQYVDLGLSVKWATCNVGATNPQDYGDYFAWGETSTYYQTLSFSFNTPAKENFTGTWNSGKTGHDSASYPYCDQNGNPKSSGSDNIYTNYVLNADHDVAHVKWGDTWRMPTETEMNELLNTDNCTWTWTTNYDGTGISGFIVTSKKPGYTNNSIFLPAEGSLLNAIRYDKGTLGHYWSANRDSENASCACYMTFRSDYSGVEKYYRWDGFAVRPVCE